MSVETPTPGDSGGDPGTPPEKAARYTDSDMAKLRQSYDHKIGKAREAGASQALSELLGDLGVDDGDELRSIVSAARERQGQQSKAELEAKKAQREHKKALEELEALRAERDALATEKRQQAIKLAVSQAAKTHDAHEDLVWALTRDTLSVSESGDVVGHEGESVGDIVKQLVDKDSRLRATGRGAGSMPAGTSAPEAPNSSTVEGMSAILDEIGIGR